MVFIFGIVILITVAGIIGNRAYLSWKANKEYTEDNEHNEHQEYKDSIIKIFSENKDVFDTLVNDVYSRNDVIIVRFSNGTIQLKVNGKIEKLSNEEYDLYKRIHKLLRCESVWLHKESMGSSESNIIEIFLRDVISDKKTYDDLILYGEDENIGTYYDEFSPGWYFETLYYT